MKYEFIVHPGGKVSDIQMQWNGLENIKKLKNSGIEYSLASGKMNESAPVSYAATSLSDAKYPVPSMFTKNNNRIGFKIGKYDKTKTLVIDPTLVWGTYFGGSGTDIALGVSTYASGNAYITGYTTSGNNIATSGAYQSSFQGWDDAFLAKFSSSGNLIWTTYYGGIYHDYGYAVNADISGNVYITGSTDSYNGIATSGAYRTYFIPGGSNGFLSKFSSTGSLTWATYYGESDGGTSLTTDASGEVYMTGTTHTINGTATTGAYQTSYGGGPSDAFLAKFSGSGSLLWATYFGGNDQDGGNGVTVDKSGNVYLTGITYSSNGIATAGAYKTYSSRVDAFLAKFSGAGKLAWATYYGGTYNNGTFSTSGARGNGVCTDATGNVYMTGWTVGGNIITSGAYQTSVGGGQDAFLAKFSSSGSLNWATFYGGKGTDNGNGVSIDANSNIYMAGTTSSSTGIATTDAYQTSLAGSQDAFLVKFNNTGSRLWATYYGGGGESAEGVSMDASGNIYVAGQTASSNGIASFGAYQTSYAGNEDAFLAKFGNINNTDAGITSIPSLQDSFCPDSQIVKVQLKNFGSKDLDSATIGLSINGNVQKPYKWSGKLLSDSVVTISLGNYFFPSGTDLVKSWSSLPNGITDSFPNNDTASISVKSFYLPNASAGPDTTLCFDEVYTMQGSGGITYLWHPAIYLSSATDPHAIATLPNTEHYMLVVSNAHGCQDSSPVLLKVRPKLKVKAIADPARVCYGQKVILSAKSSGGDSLHYQYQWVDDKLTGDSLIEKAYKSGWHQVILSDNCSPTNAIDSVYVTVIPPAKAAFVYVPIQLIKINQDISFQNQSSNAARYLWKFDANDTSDIISPDHIYTDSGEYKIMLIAYGLNQCPNDTAYGLIKIIGNQITIYIPDAFSPNGDGVNDLFILKGVGISSYSYNIYNCWGEHLYTSPSVNLLAQTGPGEAGWDGTFKGEKVPEGVYIYAFEIIDVTGRYHYINGNVTLLR